MKATTAYKQAAAVSGMYRQGRDWVVSHPWDNDDLRGPCSVSQPMDYWGASGYLRRSRASIAAHLMCLDALDRDRVDYFAQGCGNRDDVIEMLKSFEGAD